MTRNETVMAGPDDHFGFVLCGTGAPLYLAPDSTSHVLAELPAGTVVSVLQRTGDFLQVVTEDDRFGYIPESAPMSAVEGRSVKDWNTLLPDLPPSPTLEMAGIHVPVEMAHSPSAPELRTMEPARQRKARIFVDRISKEDSEAPNNYLSGVASAALGLIALLVAHALTGMTQAELGVFFMGDVLFPLFVLGANPTAPTTLLGIFVALYCSALVGYVVI